MGRTGRYERHFVRMLNDTDHWWAQRAAASGSGTDADLPDVTFAHAGQAFAGELKADAEPYLYVDAEKMAALEAYASAYGMAPVAIHRPDGERAYYVFNPEHMDRTDAGTYRGDRDGRWAAKIAHPDGAADGIHPADLIGFQLYHGLQGELCGQVTEASKDPPPDQPDEEADDATV